MLITEIQTVQREIHVAPCLECGHTEIQLTDCGYSSFNYGGGECPKCHRKCVTSTGCNPSKEALAAIWNAHNDIPTLIRAEEAVIAQAQAKIETLKQKAGPTLIPLADDELGDLMTAADYLEAEATGCITNDDGTGTWATATHRSDISTHADRPDWATHVLWLNR